MAQTRHSFRESLKKSRKTHILSGLAHEGDRLSRKSTRQWWSVRLFRGMIRDVRRRLPYFLSDWTDAWDYRVLPATVYMYFVNILPALAFSLDMFEKTDMHYGVNEVLLASRKGPITVFNYTVLGIVASRGTDYLGFMAWIGNVMNTTIIREQLDWSLIMHWIAAITTMCNALTYATRFSCDIFGFYVVFVYLQKGIQVLTRQWSSEGETSAYLSIMLALHVLICGWLCGRIGKSSLFHRWIRKFIEDYGTPLTVVFFLLATLPISQAFLSTINRGWLVNFWDIDAADIFLAIHFALLLTVLFYFDHNRAVSLGYGATTGVAGILGIPAPNGLIPQAPFHTSALCVTRRVHDKSEGKVMQVIDHVVEQRFSNLAQGILTLGTMAGPLLIVVHLIPQGVLAGLFFVMGLQALQDNGITQKLIFLAQDNTLTSSSRALRRLDRRWAVWLFVIIELVGFGGIFAITQITAAVGFPVIILLLIPVRAFLFPCIFTPEELRALDALTASPFTMECVGGVCSYKEPDQELPEYGRLAMTGPDS
ncbi:hypothetical protein ASPSYDRAFT_62941 [Aspergillus sydowii CBS 593.65]|uniref:Bicarbonate transporter-like transmembrane domain-containing protein n=1 Tax=Aspergillus sydowii CBS 593.65 TaxID=1036612 RepID=A0A1L9SYM9_9EURO|nr:uncharacterized protein ASPSYDRAFT_62941 [Aspergillus sydowii CBS 593.65]OJJ52256.1 hypothetical protein ASPSYDRAFT_62941 [Aspergillus sydowii CBS 593.65]